MNAPWETELRIANAIRDVFDLPARYNSAAFTENTLRIYFHFFSVLSGLEDLLEAETAKLASRVGCAWGRFTEGHYQKNPDANDAAVRKFIVVQFRSLASALQLPAGSVAIPRAMRPTNGSDAATDGAAAALPHDVDVVAAHWLRESIRDAWSNPLSRRSAYELEDELGALFFLWGLINDDAGDIAERVRTIKREYGAAWGTITEQFFFERPWAAREEALRFVCGAYGPVRQAIFGN